MLIEQKLAIGNLVVRTITTKNASELVQDLRSAGYGVTSMTGQGATGPVQIVFSVIQRKELNNVLAMIKRFDARAFYSVDDLQEAAQGVFPQTKSRWRLGDDLRLAKAPAAL